jgi:hypothetical protein
MPKPSARLRARRKQAEVLGTYKLDQEEGEWAVKWARQSNVQKARLAVGKARDMTKWYQKILRNVRKRVKRARISQQIMKDEQKRLAAIISEYQRETKRATQISELTNATEAESVELQSKVEVLEGELRELGDRLRASEALARQLAETFQKSEVRVWELTQRQNAMRERLQ